MGLKVRQTEKFWSIFKSVKSMSLRIFLLEFLSREHPLHFPSTLSPYSRIQVRIQNFIGAGLGSLFTVALPWLGLLSRKL